VHAGGNATTRVGDRWLTADNPSVPWLLRSGWGVANHGVGLRWLLLAVLIGAMLVDAARLLAADRPAPDHPDHPDQPAGTLLPLPFDPAARSKAWTTRLAGPRTPPAVRAVIGTACALTAYATRDLAALLAAHAPEDREPRHRALVRGRAAGAMLRALREDAMAATCPATEPRANRARARIVALTTLGVLAAATFALAPHWAHRIGDNPQARQLAAPALDHLTWLAGLLDSSVPGGTDSPPAARSPSESGSPPSSPSPGDPLGSPSASPA